MPLRLGIWDTPASDFLVSGLSGSTLGVSLTTLDPAECLQAVVEGVVDVALVPTLDVILGDGDFVVLPAVALSSWHFPFARVHLPEGLEAKPSRLVHDRTRPQEAFIAQVALREHYAMNPELAASSRAEVDESSEARLLVGREVPSAHLSGTSLDLGEEWFELANYPMVWGVFVARKGEASQEMVDRLRQMVERSETLRSQWADSKDQGETLRRFFAEDIRLRFDDLAVASITELMDHAFFLDLTDEVRDFPLARLEETEDDATGNSLLQ